MKYVPGLILVLRLKKFFKGIPHVYFFYLIPEYYSISTETMMSHMDAKKTVLNLFWFFLPDVI